MAMYKFNKYGGNMFKKKYRVMIINPGILNKESLKVLIENTPLPIIYDTSIPNGFIVVRTDKE